MDHIAVAVTFAYMWSAHQHLGPPGAWHPHIMVFAPNYDNAMAGGFAFGSPLPQLSDSSWLLQSASMRRRSGSSRSSMERPLADPACRGDVGRDALEGARTRPQPQ